MLQTFHSRFKLILIWSHPLYKKMRFPIKDFFSKCDQIRSFLRIWSHLLKKSLMENFIFCAVFIVLFFLQIAPSSLFPY